MTLVSILKEDPDFSVQATLLVEALAPLSLVTRMPGKYFRSADTPSPAMLYGLLENALGWHVSTEDRTQLIKALKKRFKAEPQIVAGSGFQPVLQYHVRFEPLVVKPSVLRYDDYWAQHLRGNSFVGGSREHSYEVIPIMEASAQKRITIKEASSARKEGSLAPVDGETVHLNLVRPYFPQYYASPTPREYVEPQDGWFQFALTTSPGIADVLENAFEDPAAPLYLGSNDGWVEVTWKRH